MSSYRRVWSRLLHVSRTMSLIRCLVSFRRCLLITRKLAVQARSAQRPDSLTSSSRSQLPARVCAPPPPLSLFPSLAYWQIRSFTTPQLAHLTPPDQARRSSTSRFPRLSYAPHRVLQLFPAFPSNRMRFHHLLLFLPLVLGAAVTSAAETEAPPSLKFNQTVSPPTKPTFPPTTHPWHSDSPSANFWSPAQKASFQQAVASWEGQEVTTKACSVYADQTLTIPITFIIHYYSNSANSKNRIHGYLTAAQVKAMVAQLNLVSRSGEAGEIDLHTRTNSHLHRTGRPANLASVSYSAPRVAPTPVSFPLSFGDNFGDGLGVTCWLWSLPEAR